LAERRASITREAGSMNVEGVCIDARTGASIRGSSMAALMLSSPVVVHAVREFSRSRILDWG
jgi:hypothetical protein